MPELPEIETIRKGLLGKVLKKPILEVQINNGSVIKNGERVFTKSLEGNSFSDILRRGKMLIFETEKAIGKKGGKKFLLARLGMTGRLVYFDKEDELWGGYSFKDKNSFSNKHCHIAICFEGGGVLLFCDTRRFGHMEIVDEMGLENKLKNFGPEPLDKDFTLKVLRDIFDSKKNDIKAFLLNQKNIAGIGNIYADEILFDASVLPMRRTDSLLPQEIMAIHKSIKKILKKAVEHRGTTFSDYVDSSGEKGDFKKLLKVYGRSGEKCLCCKLEKIQKIKLAGRGTNFCGRCQK
ncbi:MAG: DNA-formamidopyrimidine glycosylase [Candidatus Pacebacteria bacterium]|nr:DNA-formamidopyrimidine glycosylase [Candidatus Paceibacterota bacterium]